MGEDTELISKFLTWTGLWDTPHTTVQSSKQFSFRSIHSSTTRQSILCELISRAHFVRHCSVAAGALYVAALSKSSFAGIYSQHRQRATRVLRLLRHSHLLTTRNQSPRTNCFFLLDFFIPPFSRTKKEKRKREAKKFRFINYVWLNINVYLAIDKKFRHTKKRGKCN